MKQHGRPVWSYILGAFALSVVISIVGALLPLRVAFLLQSLGKQDAWVIVWGVSGIGILDIAANTLGIGTSWFRNKALGILAKTTRTKYLVASLKQHPSVPIKSSDWTNVLTNALSIPAVTLLTSLAGMIIMIIGLVGVIKLDMWSSTAEFGLVVGIIGWSYYQGTKVSKLFRENRKIKNGMQSVLKNVSQPMMRKRLFLNAWAQNTWYGPFESFNTALYRNVDQSTMKASNFRNLVAAVSDANYYIILAIPLWLSLLQGGHLQGISVVLLLAKANLAVRMTSVASTIGSTFFDLLTSWGQYIDILRFLCRYEQEQKDNATTATPRPELPASPKQMTITDLTIVRRTRGEENHIFERANAVIPLGGQRVLVLGLNGSGKSTLLEWLAGLVPSEEMLLDTQLSQERFSRENNRVWTTGRAIIDGIPIDETSLDSYGKYRSIMTQQTMLLPVTPRKNIIDGRDEDTPWLERITALLYLSSELLSRHIEAAADSSGLSGGEEQKVAIARIFASGAKIGIMDEPITEIDQPSIAGVRVLMQECSTKGMTLFFTDHTLGLTDLATWIVYLVKDEAIQSGPASEMSTRSEIQALLRSPSA